MAAVRLTVLGCSGSVVGPDSPASGYLVTSEGAPPVVIDFGGGVLGALQRHADPRSAVVLLSHLHADHCLDVPGLLVWRRYAPGPRGERGLMYGPVGTALRIGAASSETPGDIDDISDTLDLRTWVEGQSVQIGDLSVTPMAVCHPPEAFGLRVTTADGAVLVYSGDTAICDSVVELARGADVFLCEASWEHDPENKPPGLHLSGREAGEIAERAGVKRLLLTHIPPWTSREAVLAEARAAFSGPVHAVSAEESFEIAPASVGESLAASPAPRAASSR